MDEKVFQRMIELERDGIFNQDPIINPSFTPLEPGQVDYLKKKLSSKIKAFFCERAVNKFIKKNEKAKQVILEDIKGLEKLQELNSGAIIVSNHFHPFDSYPIIKALRKAKIKRKFRIVVAEHNYAGGKGFYGYVFRNKNTIPLASNKRVMAECLQAINHFLNKGDLILVYPEQALWPNYKKPRPLRDGAFKFAVKAGVPVVSCFVTMKESEDKTCDTMKWTLHILDVIKPDSSLSAKENVEIIKEKAQLLMKNKYEEVYKTELKFDTKEEK